MECSSPCCRQSTERKYTSRCPPEKKEKKKKALAIDIIVDQFRESLAVFSRVAVVPVLSLMRIRVC